MKRDWEIGETAYLSTPVNGYRHVEIIDNDGLQLVVRITDSGKEISVYEDELEES